MSKRVYRIIEYEIPESDAGAEDWLQRTLARSIDGKYNPTADTCSIVAVTVSDACKWPASDLFGDLTELLDTARERQWLPPISKHGY
jgi:hypothetical protein